MNKLPQCQVECRCGGCQLLSCNCLCAYACTLDSFESSSTLLTLPTLSVLLSKHMEILEDILRGDFFPLSSLSPPTLLPFIQDHPQRSVGHKVVSSQLFIEEGQLKVE